MVFSRLSPTVYLSQQVDWERVVLKLMFFIKFGNHIKLFHGANITTITNTRTYFINCFWNSVSRMILIKKNDMVSFRAVFTFLNFISRSFKDFLKLLGILLRSRLCCCWKCLITRYLLSLHHLTHQFPSDWIAWNNIIRPSFSLLNLFLNGFETKGFSWAWKSERNYTDYKRLVFWLQ